MQDISWGGQQTMSSNMSSKVSLKWVLLLLWIAPLVILGIGFLSRTDPLSIQSFYGIPIGMIISGWLVRQCDRVSEWHPLVPKKNKPSAFLFGFTRTCEIILILWIPDDLWDKEHLSIETLLFLAAVKVVAYMNYLYWTYQLSKRRSETV
jgi:signal transduction histidine kinase